MMEEAQESARQPERMARVYEKSYASHVRTAEKRPKNAWSITFYEYDSDGVNRRKKGRKKKKKQIRPKCEQDVIRLRKAC
ncbi:hypothetical protein Trydic_g17867 [Trypoxylus dichotomus]